MIKKIRTEDLEIGMFVADWNTPWIDHPFLPRQKRVRTAQEIEAIRGLDTEEVYIDTSKGADSPKAYSVDEADNALRARLREEVSELAPISDDTSQHAPSCSEEIPFEVEVRKAQEVYAEARSVVQTLFEDARFGRAVDADKPARTVTKMIDSIFRNRDALLSLVRLRNLDDYTFHHSIDVAVLALSLGSHLGILQDELLRLGMSALLHDLGKVRIPGALVKKVEPLTPREYEVFQTHTAHGAQILLQSATVPVDCAKAALNHHERYNGRGYPRGLRGMAVGKFGLIASIADVYDAMTTDRTYNSRVSPHQALRRIYEWAGSAFHPIYARKFIQCLGIYPIGSVLRLDTGETGVVVRQNRESPLRPWVRITNSRRGSGLTDFVDVDLRDQDPTGEKPFARSVARVLDPARAGVDLEAVLSKPAVTRRAPSLSVVVG